MIHFAKLSGGVGPINDDQGQIGVDVFADILFDGTLGGGGDIKDVSLFLFNDDNNYKYNSPTLTIVDTDPVAEQIWFKLLDNKNVLGITPTESEWISYGVPGNLSLTLDEISQAGGSNPERKLWIRAMIPDGTTTANLTGIKIKAEAVEEAV